MKRFFVRCATIATVLSILGFLPGCGGDASTADSAGPQDSETGGLTLTDRAGAAINLAVEEMRPEVFTAALTAPGKVRANQDKIALVGPIIEGKVSEVFVNWGDPVRRGQVLAYLESVEVGEAKATYFRASAELKVAEANRERSTRLFNEEIIPRKDLLEAEAEHMVARVDADAAEKALHVIGFTEEEVTSFTERHDLTSMMPIIAPISGTIVDRQAVIGALADASVVLFKIIDLGTLWVDADVYEKDLDKVRQDQRVEISVIAYPDETFAGRVSYIGDTLDEERRTTVVRTVVDNPDGKLKPGMFATVRIVTTDKADAIILPEGAVLRENGMPVVIIEEEDRYRLREVQPGPVADGRVEIVAGLSSGERVVTSGHYQIATQLLGRRDTE